MDNLLVFLKRYGYWAVFLLLEVAALVAFFSFNERQGGALLTSVNEVAAVVNTARSEVVGFVNLRHVNKQLTEDNVRLQQMVARQGQETAVADSVFGMVMARVVSQSVNRRDNYIVLDKGSSAGVTEGMGVVASNGVVGIVFLVEKHYCMVLPTINSRSSISCTLRGKNFYGYLQWGGGDARQAYLTDVPRYAEIARGDTVETSGYSAMFPRGYYVGRVTYITDADDGLSLRVDVRMDVEFASLSDVCILVNHDRAERDSLDLRLQRYWGDE